MRVSITSNLTILMGKCKMRLRSGTYWTPAGPIGYFRIAIGG
jgi:hypothetical protein